jgi:Fe-S cluster biogenesis protein NfuA
MPIETEALHERVTQLNRYIAMHAGGIEVERTTVDGQVVVRFTGMCTGCLYREATMATTIRPELLQIDGVTGVEAVGARVSAQAAARLAQAHSGLSLGLPRPPGPPADRNGQPSAVSTDAHRDPPTSCP